MSFIYLSIKEETLEHFRSSLYGVCVVRVIVNYSEGTLHRSYVRKGGTVTVSEIQTFREYL